jgi:hypothetical protein
MADLAEEQRQAGRAVDDREQERPVDHHRDRWRRPHGGRRPDDHGGGRRRLGAVLVDVDVGLVRDRADLEGRGLGDLAEVRVVTEGRGDAEPPQRRDEVERRFQPEPGQR